MNRYEQYYWNLMKHSIKYGIVVIAAMALIDGLKALIGT